MMYKRFYIGLVLFFAIYWILPSILGVKSYPMGFDSDESHEGLKGFSYLIIRAITLLFSYAQYSFDLLPFIFIISPIVSLIILSFRLKSESKLSLKQIFLHLNYEFSSSPKEMIVSGFKDSTWKKEWVILRSFLILLPFSLFILTMILNLTTVDVLNLSENSTGLGWFLEIYFIYLSTLLFGFILVRSSRLSFKGRFFGESMQQSFFSSIKQVGTPISILSILLFILNQPDSLVMIFYFSCYFLMGVVIFILNLRIFEPISIFLLLKLINSIKWMLNKKDRTNEREIKSNRLKNENLWQITYCAIIACSFSFLSFLLLTIITNPLLSKLPDSLDFYDLALISSHPSLSIMVTIDSIFSLWSIEKVLRILVFGYFFAVASRNSIHQKWVILIFSIIALIFTWLGSIVFGGSFISPLFIQYDHVWMTSTPVITKYLGINLTSIRTAFLYADFSDPTQILLRTISSPFILIRPFAVLFLWGYFIRLFQTNFMVKSFQTSKTQIERISFSKCDNLHLIRNIQSKGQLLVRFNPVNILMNRSSRFQKLFDHIFSCPEVYIHELVLSADGNYSKLKDFLITLHKENAISSWIPEFSCLFEQARLDSLYVLSPDGRNLFFHNFQENMGGVEPVSPFLVSGMFSAITSFVKETTRSKDLLRSIDCGDKVVLLEYLDRLDIFAAVFADREIATIRSSLKEFLQAFQKRHYQRLKNWNGDTIPFSKDHDLVENSFYDFI
ncbi:hypothetical protein NEF87_001530 [Candidatus Lokiarchaeum ossiferum]|uniref:Uncharacterized protein n=1 Tax=Candidatus Lokiarchaeum ossiferum TaxID=2951803 RepID=A0ABY6HPA8_9ARCH|nr:hypothetical protein NEF87_001530 [Candidatus Lokiarchaeum sp. B-35]